MTAEWTENELAALRAAQEQFANGVGCDDGVRDLTVTLEGTPGKASLVARFGHRDRPGCVFGYEHELDALDGGDPDEDDPEWQVTLMWAHLTEDIEAIDYGLPTNCRPGEIVWLGRDRLVMELDIVIGGVLDEHEWRYDGDIAELRKKLTEATGRQAMLHMHKWHRMVYDMPDEHDFAAELAERAEQHAAGHEANYRAAMEHGRDDTAQRAQSNQNAGLEVARMLRAGEVNTEGE